MKLRHIPLNQIFITQNIRTESDNELGGLMESIERYDVLQPVLVVRRNDQYELLAGHRRYRVLPIEARRVPNSDTRSSVVQVSWMPAAKPQWKAGLIIL